MDDDQHQADSEHDDDHDIGWIDDVTENDEIRRLEYNRAVRDFREGHGHDFEACVAGFVSAALLVVDPCSVQWVGLDPAAGHAYDSTGSRIWEYLCRALVDAAVRSAVSEFRLEPDQVVLGFGRADVSGHVPFEVLTEIVDRALTIEFGAPEQLPSQVAAETDTAFDRIMTQEFGPLATIRVPTFPRGDEVAMILHQRIGCFVFAVER